MDKVGIIGAFEASSLQQWQADNRASVSTFVMDIEFVLCSSVKCVPVGVGIAV